MKPNIPTLQLSNPRLIFILGVLLVLISTASAAPSFTLQETDAAITIARGDTPVLVYHKAEVPPPDGVDPVFKRSGFIHPLHTPSGAEVTGIHPEDHYHHLGLWHAWVKTKHGKDELDFWNLKDKTGRIRFSKTLETNAQDDAASFAVEQEHLGYKKGSDEPTVVLREKLTVNARFEDGANVIDYTVEQTNVTGQALELPAYRYGGCIAYRSPLHWDKTNSNYLSSEGKTRVDGHTTRSKWCAFWGPTDSGQATVAILSQPENHDFPQCMRVWPPDTNKGTIFFNYVPIQETDWEIPPGETITMQYRIVITDAKPDAEAIERQWEAYAN